MRVLFMGTPAFAATILEELSSQHEVVGVFTRPDAVRGRGRQLVASPVKEMAQTLKIPYYTPEHLADNETVQRALEVISPDVIVVAAYGALLPQYVLDAPKYGCLNVHASLLPRWRGAAPVERAILAGDEEAGVCVMRMEAGLDTGDYCVCRSVEIGDMDTDALTDRLASMGASALLVALAQLEEGALCWTKQDASQVTYAQKIVKSELNIDPSEPAIVARRKVQASTEAHPSKAQIAGRDVTLLSVSLVGGEDTSLVKAVKAGEVAFLAKRLFLGVYDGAVEVLELKPDGKQPMDAKAFCAGVQGIKQGGLTWRAL